MKFRPCIDIHNGQVKQIVGGSLRDKGDQATQNFVAGKDADYYASLYQKDGLTGGHIILLNPVGSPYYEADLQQARKAFQAFPNGLQIGGGVTIENAKSFIELGATHVIVTSYVFRNGMVDYERLSNLTNKIGKEHLVLDLSCRQQGEDFFVVTDRWQKMTQEKLSGEVLRKLSGYCDEFLVHAVDVEGKQSGIQKQVLEILAAESEIPVTYAGGIHSMDDVAYIEKIGHEKIDFTIGSALDLFGGNLSYQNIVKKYQ